MYQERMYGRKTFWKLLHVKTLSHLTYFDCYDVHLRRTVKVYISVNAQLCTQHLAGTEEDQLQHRIIHAFSIHFTSYKIFMIWKKDTSLGEWEGFGINIQDEIPWLSKPLHNVVCPHSAVLIRTHQQLDTRSSCFLLVLTHLLWNIRKTQHQFGIPRMCRAYLSRHLIVKVINETCEDGQCPLEPGLFHKACMVRTSLHGFYR